MQKYLYILFFFTFLYSNLNNTDTNIVIIPEIEIYGGLDENSNATNIQIIQSRNFNKNGQNNFDNIIAKIGSLHYAGGTARVKYFQLRGLGELSQFSGEGAPHFYVGYIIDDINFSGIGMISNLFDIKQIEVFNGPQSSIYGTNAMAGMINVISNNPKNKKEFTFNTSQYSYNGSTINTSISLPITKKIFSRFTISKNYTNSYITNISGKNKKQDTNAKNEILFRNKTLFKPNKLLSIILTSYFVDLNNKYDVWSPDNNGYITYSDFQGFDKQKSKALSINSKLKLDNKTYTIISSYSDNIIHYSYDGDWGNLSYWDEVYGYNENYIWYFGPYDFKDITNRRRISSSYEFRSKFNLKNNILSFGIYYSDIKEIDSRNGWLFAGYASNINSTFRILNYAMYMKASTHINDKLLISTSIRKDINNISQFLIFDSSSYKNDIKDKNLVGGSIDLSYKINEYLFFNSILSRGYKTSGINQTQSPFLSEKFRVYNTEYSNNIEFGITFNSIKHSLRMNTFYMHRFNPQLRLSYQIDPQDPTSFDYATFNANSAYHYGLEIRLSNYLSEKIILSQSLSSLNTYVSTFKYRGLTYGNREVAHAPKNKYNITITNYIFKNLIFEIESNYIDSFYYEEQNNEKSKSYNLINMSIRYTYKNYEISFWSRNIQNIKYPIRGYKFALDPTYEVKSYQSFGEPRITGITLNLLF